MFKPWGKHVDPTSFGGQLTKEGATKPFSDSAKLVRARDLATQERRGFHGAKRRKSKICHWFANKNAQNVKSRIGWTPKSDLKIFEKILTSERVTRSTLTPRTAEGKQNRENTWTSAILSQKKN